MPGATCLQVTNKRASAGGWRVLKQGKERALQLRRGIPEEVKRNGINS
jgi:hypothetical protein